MTLPRAADEAGKRLTAYVLTYCQNPEALYGSTLIFKTLRVGFPTAEVHVVDNNSLPEAAARIRALAEATGCHFHGLPATREHFQLLGNLLMDPATRGTVVLLHPDVCFWRSCEGWRFDALIAGRLIPAYADELSGCVMLPHLHSQYWWVSDAARFRERVVAEYSRTHLDPRCAFSPYVFKHDGQWYKLDVGAGLYAALREDVYCFGERELDAFDHLFGGTYLNALLPLLQEEDRSFLLRAHGHAERDHVRLRGLWREQEAYYQKRAVPAGPALPGTV